MEMSSPWSLTLPTLWFLPPGLGFRKVPAPRRRPRDLFPPCGWPPRPAPRRPWPGRRTAPSAGSGDTTGASSPPDGALAASVKAASRCRSSPAPRPWAVRLRQHQRRRAPRGLRSFPAREQTAGFDGHRGGGLRGVRRSGGDRLSVDHQASCGTTTKPPSVGRIVSFRGESRARIAFGPADRVERRPGRQRISEGGDGGRLGGVAGAERVAASAGTPAEPAEVGAYPSAAGASTPAAGGQLLGQVRDLAVDPLRGSRRRAVARADRRAGLDLRRLGLGWLVLARRRDRPAVRWRPGRRRPARPGRSGVGALGVVGDRLRTVACRSDRASCGATAGPTWSRCDFRSLPRGIRCRCPSASADPDAGVILRRTKVGC